MIYVDDCVQYGIGHGSSLWCHMWADTLQELYGMSAALGLKSWWVHNEHPEFIHFELSPSKREKALTLGATYKPMKGELHVKYRKEKHGEPIKNR